jgi:hypothetical protein
VTRRVLPSEATSAKPTVRSPSAHGPGGTSGGGALIGVDGDKVAGTVLVTVTVTGAGSDGVAQAAVRTVAAAVSAAR